MAETLKCPFIQNFGCMREEQLGRIFSPITPRGGRNLEFRDSYFPFFGLLLLPSRLDKPEQVKKRRAWNGMEATPFVLSFVRRRPRSLPHSQRVHGQNKNRRRTDGMDERTQRPSDGSGSGEQREAAMNSRGISGVFISLF